MYIITVFFTYLYIFNLVYCQSYCFPIVILISPIPCSNVTLTITNSRTFLTYANHKVLTSNGFSVNLKLPCSLQSFQNKANFLFVWLYLNINISAFFQLILPDHITNDFLHLTCQILYFQLITCTLT